MELSEAQKKAVCCPDGPVLVLAGPGSGKTAVLTGRVRHLIGEGISPSSILVVTFTRAAAAEMEERFFTQFPDAASGVVFSTCHSLFLQILKRECGYSARDILSETERRQILRPLMLRYGIDPGEDMLQLVSSDLSRIKNSGLPLSAVQAYLPSEEPPQPVPEGGAIRIFWCSAADFPSFYRAYNEALRSRHRIEYDDMPLLCLEAFEKNPGGLRRWQQAFSHILIDEFQDINPVQYRLLCLLALPQDNLFAVGDEDQSIYAFRGSTPQLILHFSDDHPGAGHILLNINYRCPEEIIGPSLQLIEKNSGRIAKKICGTGRTGGLIRVTQAASEAQEAQLIAEEIREEQAGGTRPAQMAVLCRSRGSMQILRQVLSSLLIPYHMKQQVQDLYDHWITQDLFAYFSLARDHGSRTDLLRILNRPERGLPREMFTREGCGWESWQNLLPPDQAARLTVLQRDLDRIARFSPYAALQYILDGVGYGWYLKEQAAAGHIPQEEMLRIPQLLLQEAKRYACFSEWHSDIRLRRENAQQSFGQEKEGVLLSTIHGVKGLEFDCVWLMHVNEGLLPLKAASAAEELEEERRLFYVAMTRSRSRLRISCLKKYHAHILQPSRFLAEAGLPDPTVLPESHTVSGD